MNVENSTFTANPPLNIHQGDTCSHVLLIKLRNNEEFISLDKDITYKLFYYRTYDKELIETESVEVVNYYRGILSHIVSNTVVENFGNYTCYLRGYLDEDIVSTVSFPIIISKAHDYVAKVNEVIITKEFYEKLKKHLSDTEIHLDEADRDFLDTFNDQIDVLSKIIKNLHWDDLDKTDEGLIAFVTCTDEEFKSIEHDNNKLYFVKDTGRIYKGDVLYGGTDSPNLSGDDINITIEDNIIKAITFDADDSLDLLYEEGIVEPIATTVNSNDCICTFADGKIMTY